MSEEDDVPLVVDTYRTPSFWRRHKGVIAISGAVITLSCLLAILIALASTHTVNLPGAIEIDHMLEHLEAFSSVASQDGSRAVLTGYKDSADYVQTKLSSLGCLLSTEKFETCIYTEHAAPTLALLAPYTLSFQYNVDFRGMRYGGNSTVNFEAEALPIPNGGCNATNYVGVNGRIALVEMENSCDLITKAMTAQEAGAQALIFYNRVTDKVLYNSRVRAVAWFPGDPLVTIPVLSASYSLGQSLLHLSEQNITLRLSLSSNNTIEIAESFNILCETTEGEPNSVIMLGAHLDGVPEGPGINDNGSGSAAVLELAVQWYAHTMVTHNRIRFAWWGSEEVGLVGSRNYVKQHAEEIKNSVALYLNFDMLGSPNGYPGVFRGSSSPVPEIRNASDVITSTFLQYFDKKGLPYKLAVMSAGSDYVPFAEAGIPCGGLETGAGSIKTAEERVKFGGFANAPYDPCYHLACDSLDNVNLKLLETQTQAAAYTLQKLAETNNLREYLQGTSED